MKKILYFSALLLALCACKKENSVAVKVEENGLTVDINSLVPQSTIDKMMDLGMPINTGVTPPNLEGIFNATPFLMTGTSMSGDYAIGYQFADYRVQFQQLDRKKLTIKVNYYCGGSEGTGLGAFIVGTGNKFTVFVKVNNIREGKSALLTEVISGTLEAGVIKNFFYANFMIDNYGNTTLFMGNGEGRVLKDSDGTSEKVTSLKSAILKGELITPTAPFNN